MNLNELSGCTRIQIVQARCIALQFGASKAIEFLNESQLSEDDQTVRSDIAVAMAKAELLHLDGSDAAASAIFEEVLTKLEGLSQIEEIIVRHNRNDVQSSLWSPETAKDFYNLVDQQRLTRFELTDSRAVLAAKNAALQGKHYVSLPDLWNELRRTYYQGCWRAYRWASKDFAEECMQLGWPEEACIHAIVALDSPTAKRAGQCLMVLRQLDRVSKASSWMVANTALMRHFAMACEIFCEIADAIPDAQIPVVLKWALNRASAAPSDLKEGEPVRAAWKVVRSIAHRLDGTEALAVVDLATSHPWWSRFCVDRSSLRQVVGKCISVLPAERLASLAQDLIGHIIDKQMEHDYVEAVELICRVSAAAGNDLTADIANRLYKKGNRLTAPLVQVAKQFGKEAALLPNLEAWAVGVIEGIPLQVQRLNAGDEARPCGETYFQVTTNTSSGGQLIVHMIGTTSVHSVVSHRHTLSPITFDSLVVAILQMLQDEDNILVNKTSLLEVLVRCSDLIAERSSGSVFDAVAPLARGEIVEPSGIMSFADAEDPLNRYKLGTGKPSEVQAAALYLLAEIERVKPGVFGESLEVILEDAITNAEPEVREFAFAAWRIMPRVPRSVVTSIILGTRDPEERPAIAAYNTIAASKAFSPTVDDLKVLCQSLTVSVCARSPQLRRAAAMACGKLAVDTATGAMKLKLNSLLQQYRDDICFSVRDGASMKHDANF